MGATTLATPNLELTLYFRKSPSMPLFNWPATLRLRLIIWAKSQVGLAAVAELLAVVLDQLDQVGVGQEGLGRDAAPVQADAAQLVALDAEHALLELGGADRAGVAGGAAADHHDVVVVGHGFLC